MDVRGLAIIVAISLAVVVRQVSATRQQKAPIHKAPNRIKNEYIITLQDESDIEVVARKIRRMSVGRMATGLITHKLRNVLPTILAKLSDDVLDMVRDLDQVKYVSENGWVSPESHTIQWGLDRIDQPDLDPNDDYTTQYTGKGVNVYVIDNDFVPDHPEFGGRAQMHTGCSVGDGSRPEPSGHGTHVAGVVGSNSYGVAKGANLYLLQYIDTSSVEVMLDCLVEKIEKPAVISMSFRINYNSFNDFAAAFVNKTDVNIVTSAGNTGTDACDNPPSGAKEVITVGATSISDWIYEKSNTGPCVDLLAPGKGIISIGIHHERDIRSGTSQACPHVSGTLALLMEKEGRHIGYPEGEELLIETAVKNKIKGVPEDTPNLLLQVPK